jgi:Reverse transcriptase (RNA-dependent DNA polymerase)
MNIEIFDLREVGEGRYSISLRKSGIVSSYVLKLSEDPILGLSGPESFWALVEADKEALQQVLSLLTEFHQTGSSALPKQLLLKGKDSRLFGASLPWTSRSSVWNLSNESIVWALKHLATNLNNTLFPLPFEHEVILERLDDFSNQITRVNVCRHEVRDFRRQWVPKSAAGRRYATQLDPLDAAILTAITYELGEVIETSRIPSADKIVFGFRFLPSAEGNIWDSETNYPAFQEHTMDFLLEEDTSVVAETDIAAFYHSTKLDLVGSQLERVGVRRKHSEAVTTLLKSMNIEGLPVGPSFSALFAQLVLTPIDLHLLSLGAKFVRYNDDYRFFCRDDGEAQSILESFADALLRTSGLVLQNEKTRISSKEDFLSRFEPNWLTNLYVDVEEGDDSANKLVNSARSVLEKSVDDSHVAYVRLCHKAFKALPLEEKRSVLPLILEQLDRVWGVAPAVSKSLEDLLPQSDGGRELLELVRDRFESQSVKLPDYAVSWVLHAFSKEEWQGKESLATLDAKLTATQDAARRELLIALRKHVAASAVRYDANNPWHHRAKVWATGDAEAPPDIDESDTRLQWLNTLYDALISTHE